MCIVILFAQKPKEKKESWSNFNPHSSHFSHEWLHIFLYYICMISLNRTDNNNKIEYKTHVLKRVNMFTNTRFLRIGGVHILRKALEGDRGKCYTKEKWGGVKKSDFHEICRRNIGFLSATKKVRANFNIQISPNWNWRKPIFR